VLILGYYVTHPFVFIHIVGSIFIFNIFLGESCFLDFHHEFLSHWQNGRLANSPGLAVHTPGENLL